MGIWVLSTFWQVHASMNIYIYVFMGMFVFICLEYISRNVMKEFIHGEKIDTLSPKILFQLSGSSKSLYFKLRSGHNLPNLLNSLNKMRQVIFQRKTRFSFVLGTLLCPLTWPWDPTYIPEKKSFAIFSANFYYIRLLRWCAYYLMPVPPTEPAHLMQLGHQVWTETVASRWALRNLLRFFPNQTMIV